MCYNDLNKDGNSPTCSMATSVIILVPFIVHSQNQEFILLVFSQHAVTQYCLIRLRDA